MKKPTPSHQAALDAMRRLQRQARLDAGLDRALFAEDQLARALSRVDERERTSTIEEGWVYSGIWRYTEAVERLRWARTRDILCRCSPGEDEDGSYLEMIARQAASAEIVLCGAHEGTPDAKQQAVCERLLYCTLPMQNLDAYASGEGTYHFVLISAGLIDFVYQVTKATVLSWMPKTPKAGSGVSFSTRMEDVEAVLDKDSGPVLLLQKTLESYLFDGVARARISRPPPRQYEPPLAMLTSFNERFIVAHEIAHVLHQVHDVVYPDVGMVGEEFAADLLALRWALAGCASLDRMAPNMAAQGGFFSLMALDVLRQATDIVRFGELREDHGEHGHPPFAQRRAHLQQFYLQEISAKNDALAIHAAMFPAQVLARLWERVMTTGGVSGWHGRPLHPIWATA